MRGAACSGVRSIIGDSLLTVQTHAVFYVFHQILLIVLAIVEKSLSVGMTNRQRPALRDAHIAPTALFSSESVVP